MDTDFLLRQDNTQKIFLSEDVIDIVHLLKSEYEYIFDSIEDEGFILKYDTCNLFKELICEKKVVGFCSYDFSREFMTVALNNIYILPEFRGRGIFLRELQTTMEEHNKPSIMEPTRLVVELLIRYGFASKITDSIVASAIEFIIPGDHVMADDDYGNEELSTHFYDLEMCASFHILDLKNGKIAYSSPLNYDIIHYDCIENRQDLNEEYFSQVIKLFEENEVDLMNIILDLEENLPIKKYTLEEVIGGENGFSPYIESLIDDAHVTYEQALKIKEQIREEYESGMILNDSLLIRLAYLFGDDIEPRIKSHEDVCPYCSMPIDSHDKYCHYCGINLSYDVDEMQESLINTLNTSKSDFTEDIRFISYKFLKLIDEKIELAYSIATIENTYNIEWSHLEHFLKCNGYFEDGSITYQGYEFLESHPLHFWQKYGMDIVNYTDFENYFYAHDELNPLARCIAFLNQFDDDYICEIIEEIKKDIKD